MGKLKSPPVIWGIAIVLYILYIIFFFTTIYSGKSRKLKETERIYRTELKSVERLRDYVKDYDKIIAEKDSLLALWEETKKFLPAEERMEKWLSEISAMGITSGVEIKSFKPGTPIQKELYLEYPIDVEIVSGYHELGAFLSLIANSERIMRIEDLQLSQNTSEEEPEQTVKARMRIMCYVYHPATVTTQQTGGRRG